MPSLNVNCNEYVHGLRVHDKYSFPMYGVRFTICKAYYWLDVGIHVGPFSNREIISFSVVKLEEFKRWIVVYIYLTIVHNNSQCK